MGTMSVVPDSSLDSAWASRLRRRRWTDPRLLVGLVLVAVATVAGSRVVAAADDTTPVWAVAGQVRAGDVVRAEGLVPAPVQIGDGGDASLYLPADQPPPGGVFTRDLAAGELVPATAVGDRTDDDGADLPLSVELGDAPADLAAGDLVDVWAVPAETAAATPPQRAARVLAAVPVVSVADPAAGLGGTTRQVLVRIDSSPDQLGGPLTRLAGSGVVLVRVGD